jgi:NAD(P)H-quinone oxidoreductase subunit 5
MITFFSAPLLCALALTTPAVLLFATLVPRRAAAATALATALALCVTLGASLGETGSALGARVDAVTCTMLLLVSSLGALVVRFSRTYLDGDPGLERCLRWLLATLGAVTLLVVANDLLVIAAAWTATSFALQHLLLFYPDRPAAVVAAHKKLLVSRLADLAFLAALALVYTNVGSFDLDHLSRWVAQQAELPTSMHVGAVLLVVAVAARSAQLPFHGWITQVMEAPTPVSALLHAGVVNIGGFILIRLAPWLSAAEPARLFLVVVALFTATVGALVATTRVSVKVGLAWSTISQMGFLLLQCGLGLWSLALLHLVAHSLYKAHAFLSAGQSVETWKTRALAGPPPPPTLQGLLAATALGLALAFGVLWIGRDPLGSTVDDTALIVLASLLGLSLVPMFLGGAARDARGALAVALHAGAVVLLYVGWHSLAEGLLPASHTPASPVAWALTATAFATLFVIKSSLTLRPDSPLARSLHPRLFSGLHLDEWVTSLAFRLWPPRRVHASHGVLAGRGAATSIEVQT